MKRVYIVRHGQSTKNTSPIRLGPEAPLTPRGKEQSHAIAERCKNLGIQKIITSPFVRTVETARPISTLTGAPLEESSLFVEHKRPSEQIGLRRDDPVALRISSMVKEHFHEPHYRYSDEENFLDLKERAKNALDHLIAQTDETLLVVTHGLFVRCMVAYAMHGDRLTSYELKNALAFYELSNTGLTYMTYDDAKDHPWTLHVWNDDAHLGEMA